MRDFMQFESVDNNLMNFDMSAIERFTQCCVYVVISQIVDVVYDFSRVMAGIANHPNPNFTRRNEESFYALKDKALSDNGLLQLI
jgi:hypothetical protein